MDLFSLGGYKRAHENCWTKPFLVLKCLNLKRVSLLQFRGLEHEVEVVKYILKNARVLERMSVLSGLLS